MAIPIRKCVAHIIIIYTHATITTIKHLLINQETGVYYVKGYGSTVITAKSGDESCVVILFIHLCGYGHQGFGHIAAEK